MKILLVSVAVLCAGVNFAAPAAAADLEKVSIAVPYSDLDLSQASGLATFKGRVKAMAARTCGDTKISPVEEAAAIRQCRAEMASTAERQVRLAQNPSSGAMGASR